MKKDAFVFAICGERHAARLNLAIKFLKGFSRRDIIVVKGRASLKLDCDQVITPRIPAGLDNHQASIFLKTSLHKILARERRRFCYLDSDVIAVNDRVDTIFKHAHQPVSFAADHCSLRQFSRHAVNCHCTSRECEHLHEAIHKTFGVKITPKAWQHWNGGVFVFDEASSEFMDLWHKNTLSIFKDPYWQIRDQGSLVATVWQMGLQNHPLLPREYNFIVDPLDGVPRAKRGTVQPRELLPNESYSLRNGARNGAMKPHPAFLHLINGGAGKRGWKNWDEVEHLLETKVSRLAPAKNGAKAKAKGTKKSALPADTPLSADNRIVHGLWIGPTLSKMELLTIKSFLRHGHEFHLWVYDKIQTPLPKELILEDANKIIPKKRIIKKADTDPETGVGKGSFSSPFSDLFRYKLLYEKGGYWVDMDITCLRPLNFSTPYVFRPHRVGVVGSVIKCPRHSRLMKTVYERVAREANEHTEWLMPNRVLSQTVRRLRLTRYIQAGIWNEDSWWGQVRPYALGDDPIPSGWFAIHWINEFWRTLKQHGGFYRGKRLFDVAPEKENPKPGSALARLYAEYGLEISANGSSSSGAPAKPKQNLVLPLNKPAERQPATPQFLMTSHINILLPSLTRGGAERSVLETLTGLQRRNASAKLFVLHGVRPSYSFSGSANVQVFRLNSPDLQAKLHTVAAEILASPEPLVYTHMVKAELLRSLWERGVQTVPVIQNARPSWQDSPAAFNHPNVPFVVAVSEAVAEQLREDKCPRPVVVVRHELQRWFTPEEQQENRRQIRERHGIADDTLVLGMVGEFKSQKAYTRAVRVLAQIRKIRPVKLMILGGWDHEWGHGRHAYAATCRLALELNVITDLLTLGPVPDAERHYAAFDVFLNTSAFEGLSVALLEAIQTGCPIVTADAGGNAEILPERAVLIQDSSDISAYVGGIAQVLKASSRTLAPKPHDFDLVPRLWCLLGQYGRPDVFRPLASRTGTLFLTENLNIGGAQRSLMNLLCTLPRTDQTWLCVLETIYGQGYLDTLEKRGVPVFSIHNSSDYLDRIERILCLIERLNVRNVCFWNVDARIKLLLAKLLPPGSVRLIDVSPGPAFFVEMERTRIFQRRISFRAADYWARLDHFVAKYQGGAPAGLRVDGRKVAVIPNGVPAPPPVEHHAPALPPGADPRLVIGTACRIMPGKRIDFLIDMMAELNASLPGATLIIVGGIDPRHTDYWPLLLERLHSKQVTNIHFAGPQSDVTPFLRLFKIFVMLADQPGCPNASLEAMALGLPVIANSAGGTAEQIRHGVNGFLVSGDDPKEMARHVRHLLVNKAIHRRFSAAARTTAAKDFTMDLMTRRYRQLLAGPARAVPVARAKRHSKSPVVNKR
ncbi:MAG TPA: glycosyltransferase [Opitutaceae bacterium]|nr:glycosyltransferase [Opitutaceae bacterium]